MTRLALLVAALVLAGCTAESDAPDVSTTPAATNASSAVDASMVPDAPGMPAARFPGATALVATVWANGTLEPQMASRAPGAPGVARSPAVPIKVDVSALAPRGVPIILVGEVRATMTQGDIDIWFDIPFEDLRNGAFDAPRGGNSRVERGIVRVSGEPITLNILYDEAEPAASVPYTLSASVRFDPSLVPSAFPIGVTIPEGATSFDVDLLGERRAFGFDLEIPNLMLWGPDDAFLGHRPLAKGGNTIELPEGAPGGEYVVLLSQGARAMRILVAGDEPATLRALPQSFTFSQPHTGSTPQKAEWTVEHARVPILAGVLFTTSTVATDITVKLTSPAGVLLDGTMSDTTPFVNAAVPEAGGFLNEFWWDSAYGVPNLAAGTYHASIACGNGAGTEGIRAQDIVVFWTR